MGFIKFGALLSKERGVLALHSDHRSCIFACIQVKIHYEVAVPIIESSFAFTQEYLNWITHSAAQTSNILLTLPLVRDGGTRLCLGLQQALAGRYWSFVRPEYHRKSGNNNCCRVNSVDGWTFIEVREDKISSLSSLAREECGVGVELVCKSPGYDTARKLSEAKFVIFFLEELSGSEVC